ncbi:MAG: universal stress protein [Eubacteriales bacterium]|nr:universal stress protein [Eubacteriales bacterium]
MKKILLPVDFSDYAKKIAEEGKNLAACIDSDLVLLYVAQHRTPIYLQSFVNRDASEAVLSGEKKKAKEMLEDLKNSMGELADRTETVILVGNPADKIIEYIKSNDVDYVIMGSQGIGSPLQRAYIGSVTNKVLHNVDVSVLVIK